MSKPGIPLTRLSIAGDFTTFEYVCCRVASRGTPAIILTVYRPGSTPVSDAFFRQFEVMIERLALMSGVIAITGDINIRLDRPTDPHCVQFNELLDSFGLQQLVVQPTHRLGGILDVVITQGGFTGQIPEVRDVGPSDHSCILWLLNVS